MFYAIDLIHLFIGCLLDLVLGAFIVWPVRLPHGFMMRNQVLASLLEVALVDRLRVLGQDHEVCDVAKESQVGDAEAVAKQELLVSQKV